MDRERANEQAKRLTGVLSVVRGYLVENSRTDIKNRYAAGVVLRDVAKEPDTYGTAAIETLAVDLCVSETILREHISVATRWTKEEVGAFIELYTPGGMPLSWSHLVLLSSVRDAARREALLRGAADGAWSVRDLRRRIAEREPQATPRRQDQDDSDDGQGPAALALEEGARICRRAAVDIDTFAAALADRLTAKDVDGALVARTRASIEKLQQASERALELLGRARAATRESGERLDDDEDLPEDVPVANRRVTPR